MGVFGPVNTCCGVTASVGHDLYCENHQELPPMTDQSSQQHYMLPGSHERAGGPECRCGWGWDRWNDRCLSQAT